MRTRGRTIPLRSHPGARRDRDRPAGDSPTAGCGDLFQPVAQVDDAQIVKVLFVQFNRLARNAIDDSIGTVARDQPVKRGPVHDAIDERQSLGPITDQLPNFVAAVQRQAEFLKQLSAVDRMKQPCTTVTSTRRRSGLTDFR